MDSAPIRIAVISTPRSGNTWVRHLIADAYRLPHFAIHLLGDAEWENLPAECVVQIHWRRTPAFLARLKEHRFRVVSLARHPFDVLLSILQFSLMAGDTGNWLQGAEGDESGLYGAMPRSRSFVEYAAGRRAAELLSVTTDWWRSRDSVCTRYEDFVADPVAELRRLTDILGPPRVPDLAEVAEKLTLSYFRSINLNGHFWRGQPGQWKGLLPAAEAEEIAASLHGVLTDLGYACDADPHLSAAEADGNWVRHAGQQIRRAIARSMEGQLAEMKIRHNSEAAAILRAQGADEAIVQLQAQVALQEKHLAEYHQTLRGLDRSSLRLARRIQALLNRFSPAWRFGKRLLLRTSLGEGLAVPIGPTKS